MSANWGKKMDDIFDAHKNSIESRLWQMVRCFEVNTDMSPSNINCTKELFALLNQRLQTMCQHVCSKKIARSSLVPSHRSHLAVPDGEQSKSDQSPNGNKNSTKRQFVDQPVDNQMKKRPKTEITRPSHTIAILGASSTSSKMIRAFCFFCEEPLQMEYSAWKVHWLNHTGENTSSSSERCVQEESGLKGFMCKVCDHLQLNKVEAIKHLWQEHFKSPQEIHENLERVTLMPNLNSLTEPIKTAYEFVPNTQRYRCPIYACSIGWKTFDKFKAHLNHDHREANGFTCLHCKEFFGRNIDHASVHGNIVTECGDCKNLFLRDFDVLLHQLSRHDDDDGIHMYRRNFRYSSNVMSLQEISVIFECALCKERFDSQTQAVQHYIKGHSSRHISLTLIRLMKEVNYDSTISYSLIQGGSSFVLQQHFVCGHCKQVLYTKDAMTLHHRHHRYQQLAINFTRIHLIDTTVTDNFWVPKVSFDQYLFYYCEHCKPDFKNSKVYGHVDDVYDHWRSTHGNGSKSFRFLVAQLAQCYYCKFISTFQGLQKHQNIHHRQCSFAILHLIDPLKCGLCASTIEPGKDFVKHFQTAHELVLKSNVFNPIAMDNGALKELIKIKGNQKHKCTRCNKIFDTKTAFLDHVNRHSTHNQSDQFYDNESVHMMAGCCDTVMKPFDFSHFKEHYYRSKRHQKQDRGVKKERDAIMMDYFQTKVVFGNGMVLNKHCLLGTDLDDRQDFENYIDQLIQTYE